MKYSQLQPNHPLVQQNQQSANPQTSPTKNPYGVGNAFRAGLYGPPTADAQEFEDLYKMDAYQWAQKYNRNPYLYYEWKRQLEMKKPKNWLDRATNWLNNRGYSGLWSKLKGNFRQSR